MNGLPIVCRIRSKQTSLPVKIHDARMKELEADPKKGLLQLPRWTEKNTRNTAKQKTNCWLVKMKEIHDKSSFGEKNTKLFKIQDNPSKSFV